MVRAAARRALGRLLAPAEVEDLLLTRLVSADAGGRRAALYALARLEPALPPERLAALAVDTDPDVRLALARLALPLCAAPRRLLAVLARDADPEVRSAAALTSEAAAAPRAAPASTSDG